MGPFNNREVATAFWLLIFAAWALRKTEIRRSVGGVCRAFWHFKIVASVCLMIIYVTGMVAFLATIGIGNVGLLKDTIVWFFVGAMAMMMRFATGDDNIFRKIVTDSVKIVILLEFLVNTYTFPLVVELILVPSFTLIAMIDVVARMEKKHASVVRLVNGIQMVAGFIILWVAVNRAIVDFENLKYLDTFRSIALAPLLSVLMFPFIYIMLVYSNYELVFIRLDFDGEKTQKLKRYMRRKVMMYAGLSLERLQYLLRNHMVDLAQIEKESDVDSFFRQARREGVSEGKE